MHLTFLSLTSSVPQVRALVELDRSSSSESASACCSVAAFALIGLFSGVSTAVAVPACWNSFVQGIGLLSQKRFARYLKFSCAV